MANDLTGEFDVVAEFAVPAANRVLAAMHRIGRFPHSIALRVDDTPQGPGGVRPSVIAGIDAFGDAIVNHQHIGTPNPFPGQLASTDAIYSALDPLVNLDFEGVAVDPIVPSHLKGWAQLQLFPPSLEIADSSGKNVTVHLSLIARYFAETNTSPVAEFVRGELKLTAAVDQVASQTANVIDIAIKANTLIVNFTPSWSSRPFTAEDRAGIDLLIRNALKTSFLPSNSTLPAGIAHMQFKTLYGPHSAIAALLNMTGSAGNPASLHNVFLGAADDFALAAGADFVRAAFQPTMDNILSRGIEPVKFGIDYYLSTYHVTYTITLQSVTLALQNGRIVLAIKGHAHTGTSWLPDFDFTVTQPFTFAVDGATADLVIGDMSLDTSSWVANLFKNAALPKMRAARDQALSESNAQSSVRKMLSADQTIGGFLKSLLSSTRRKAHVFQRQEFQLAYTSVDIRPAGIVLHGSLSVVDWPAAHIEFEKIPSTSGSGMVSVDASILHGPDYSALKSWIPGGTISEYEWQTHGQTQQGFIERNKFVFAHPQSDVIASASHSPSSGATGAISDVQPAANAATVISGYIPLCLTVRGSRLSSSGPVVMESVTATVCGYNSFPILSGLEIEAVPLVLLAQSDAEGFVRADGHMPAQVDNTGAGTPNLIVYFGDSRGTAQLEFLTRAVAESGRDDAATAVIAVLPSDSLKKTRYAAGVVYADDYDGAWRRRFGVTTAVRPLTLIAGPKGNIQWQHEGAIDTQTLAAALRKSLTARSPVKVSLRPSSVKIGQFPPNFLFEYAPGHELTLRKLTGRAAILIFWKRASTPSIEAVREWQQNSASMGSAGPVVLAINNDDAEETGWKQATQALAPSIIVPDSARRISLAYGVTVWPTIIFVEAQGMVSGIRYGRHMNDQGKSTAAQTTVSA